MAQSRPLIPKNVQRLATRTLLLLLILAAGVFGIQWYLGRKGDLDLLPANTKGMIVAVQSFAGGERVVVIKPDGTLIPSPGSKEGATDRDPTWNPSGNRVLFVSDRSGKAFHVYRWNPESEAEPDQRTVDNSGRSSPSFALGDVPDADKRALITSRGNVEELIPGEARTLRVLPPLDRNLAAGDAEGGGIGSFESVYQRIGTSFRVARWCQGRDYVVAVMRRDQGGEVLVLQSLIPTEKGGLPPPQPIIAGERIEFDVSATGTVAYSVQAFDFPTAEAAAQATVKNKVRKPFRNAIGIVTFDANGPKGSLVVATKDDQQAFGRVAISPDGSQIVTVAGTFEDGIRSKGLLTFPAREGGAASGSLIVNGEVDYPSFSRSGDQLVYVRRAGSERGIFVASPDGGNERGLTIGKGDFSDPHLSPQR